MSEGDEIVDPAYEKAVSEYEAEERERSIRAEAAEFMSEDEIKALPSAEAIQAATAAARRARDRARAEFVSPAPSADAAPTEERGSPEDDIEIPPETDQVDPGAWKAVKALKERLARMEKSAPRAEPKVGSHDWLFARAVADVPEIGDGPTESLPRNSAAFALRERVVREAERVRAEAGQAGKAVPSAEDAFASALRIVCGSQVAEAENRRKVAAAAAREAAIRSRPGGERRVLPPGKDRAIAAILASRKS